MRLIDADELKENILSGLYIFCQENKEDIARAIDSEPTVEPDFKLFREWKCTDCEEREQAYNAGYQKAKELYKFTLVDVENFYRRGLKKGLSEWETERPQGEWISNGASTFGFNNPGKKCSLCGKVVEFSEKFCPGCGADMGGKNNEID